MAQLRIYNDIDCQDNKFWYQWFGGDCVCFQDIDTFAKSIPENDDTIDMRIFCNGGSVVEGWAIYDRLRQSGKKISCIIEGKAASMATIIMLAAPKENRKAYENASLLLHNPWIPCWALEEQVTAKDLENHAEEMRMWQNKMVDAYVERCGCDREEVQALMDKDIFIDTKESIRLGLISATVPAISASAGNSVSSFINNSSKKQNPMAKEQKKEIKASLLDKILAHFGVKSLDEVEQKVDEPQSEKKDDVVSMELNTSDGQVLTVEREEGDPQVGDKASPDGTFEMPDGKTIVVEDGVITDIKSGDGNENNDNDEGGEGEGGDDTVAKLKKQVAALQTELEGVKAELSKAQSMAKTKDDMRILNAVKMAGGEKLLAKFASSYVPQRRQLSGKQAGEQASMKEDKKDAVIAKLKKLNGKK